MGGRREEYEDWLRRASPKKRRMAQRTAQEEFDAAELAREKKDHAEWAAKDREIEKLKADNSELAIALRKTLGAIVVSGIEDNCGEAKVAAKMARAALSKMGSD